MYIYFSHQNDVPCLHVQECFYFVCVSLAPENVFNISTYSMFVHKFKESVLCLV